MDTGQADICFMCGMTMVLVRIIDNIDDKTQHTIHLPVLLNILWCCDRQWRHSCTGAVTSRFGHYSHVIRMEVLFFGKKNYFSCIRGAGEVTGICTRLCNQWSQSDWKMDTEIQNLKKSVGMYLCITENNCLLRELYFTACMSMLCLLKNESIVKMLLVIWYHIKNMTSTFLRCMCKQDKTSTLFEVSDLCVHH